MCDKIQLKTNLNNWRRSPSTRI